MTSQKKTVQINPDKTKKVAATIYRNGNSWGTCSTSRTQTCWHSWSLAAKTSSCTFSKRGARCASKDCTSARSNSTQHSQYRPKSTEPQLVWQILLLRIQLGLLRKSIRMGTEQLKSWSALAWFKIFQTTSSKSLMINLITTTPWNPSLSIQIAAKKYSQIWVNSLLILEFIQTKSPSCVKFQDVDWLSIKKATCSSIWRGYTTASSSSKRSPSLHPAKICRQSPLINPILVEWVVKNESGKIVLLVKLSRKDKGTKIECVRL